MMPMPGKGTPGRSKTRHQYAPKPGDENRLIADLPVGRIDGGPRLQTLPPGPRGAPPRQAFADVVDTVPSSRRTLRPGLYRRCHRHDKRAIAAIAKSRPSPADPGYRQQSSEVLI